MTPPTHAPSAERFQHLGDIESFLFAGNAVVTVVSKKTGHHATFKFKRPDPEPGKDRPTWVSRMNGPEDKKDGGYMATICGEHGTRELRRSKKSQYREESPFYQLLKWVVASLDRKVAEPMEQAEFWHEGRCGRCGRALTDPVSISRGLGPECASKA